MKTILTIMMLMIAGLSLAQTSKQTQYAAYLKASKIMWERSIDQAKSESGEESFQTAMAMYGLLNNTMATEDEDTFDEYKDFTVELLEKLIEENPEWGEPRAVLSSTYGLVMAYSPMKGMFLGMKSSSLMEEAMRLQPESPLVQKLFAGSKLYTPEMFGGDPEVAVSTFQKALEIYEQSDTTENWLYLDTMMGLALAYRKTDQNEKAKATLERAVAIEPQYHWAKSVLEKINKS
ncbi:tetratricopeptide repeat protein [Ekhidna sp.]|uniref:tetratricopeptide repeat protein n=1 Tax=Ekhidna sp. TaxID=2608089 RepID=UPI0032ED5C77